MNPKMFAASTLLLLAIALATWQVQRQPKPIPLTPTISGETEYCQTCHADLPEISASHPVQAFGCIICHGGERLALQADLAHSSMRGGGNPSSFDVVQASCGGSECHSGDPTSQRDHIQRVNTSLQSTYAGAIANIRFTFGAQPDLTARQGIYAIEDDPATSHTGIMSLSAFAPEQESNPALLTFARNCLTCHLSSDPLPGLAYARLSGCAACHTPTADTDLTQPLHRLTTAIPYSQCNTCHNRGNYDLRLMEFTPRSDHPVDRLGDYYQPIAQFVRCEWTLDCLDCHTRLEAMGDGDLYNNQKEIQYVQCRTCHGTLEELPITLRISDPEDIAMRMAFLNPVIDLKIGDVVIVTERGERLWNTRQLTDGTYELYGKASGQRFTFRPVMESGCLQDVEQQESQYCHACHAVER